MSEILYSNSVLAAKFISLDASIAAQAAQPLPRLGQATLVAGSKIIANTSITVKSRVFLNASTVAGTQGILSSATTAGVGFTITSSNGADISTIDYLIIEG